MPTLREVSRTNFNTIDKSIESVNAGSLQRIADATELMAKNYLSLQNTLEWYKKAYNNNTKDLAAAHKRISALKGVITKLKKSSSHSTNQ